MHALIRNMLSGAMLLLVAGAAGADAIAGGGGSATIVQPAERVIVYKQARRMELWRGGTAIATYKVSLGLNAVGHKQREGDLRTPEGYYRLTRRNSRSEFFLSVQVSYPEAADIAAARRHGWSPGGLIMIHGLPNSPRQRPEYYRDNDWTDGCIALSNADMLDFWLLTSPDTPIEIRP